MSARGDRRANRRKKRCGQSHKAGSDAWPPRSATSLRSNCRLPARCLLAAAALGVFLPACGTTGQERANDPVAPAPDEKPRVRVANAEATARARKFVEYGYARFRQQQFSDAYQHYRKAAGAAPNLPEAHFRAALAQVALGRYEPAMKSVRRAALLDADWPKSTVRLSQLYGDNRAAKQMHLEQLATAAEKGLDNKDLMFLLAVELFCDDQPARAKLFFKRAGQLGIEPSLVTAFLDANPNEHNAQDL